MLGYSAGEGEVHALDSRARLPSTLSLIGTPLERRMAPWSAHTCPKASLSVECEAAVR